jgi:hypothetical protein
LENTANRPATLGKVEGETTWSGSPEAKI